jgi:hypothetical protein
MTEPEDSALTFSDEDFERRYSLEEGGSSASGSPTSSRSAARQTQPLAPQLGRSRNRFMRTLLRRRMASSGI